MSGILHITEDQLAKHNTATDCWIAYNGQVHALPASISLTDFFVVDAVGFSRKDTPHAPGL